MGVVSDFAAGNIMLGQHCQRYRWWGLLLHEIRAAE